MVSFGRGILTKKFHHWKRFLAKKFPGSDRWGKANGWAERETNIEAYKDDFKCRCFHSCVLLAWLWWWERFRWLTHFLPRFLLVLEHRKMQRAILKLPFIQKIFKIQMLDWLWTLLLFFFFFYLLLWGDEAGQKHCSIIIFFEDSK